MMNVNFLIHIIKSNALTKYVKYSYILKYCTNALALSKFRNMHTSLNDSSFKVCIVREFSTTDTLLKSKDRYKEKKQVIRVDPNEIASIVDVDYMTSQFERAIEKFEDYLTKYLSLRTRVGAIEELNVTFEDDVYTLEEVVQINRKPNMVVIDASAFPQMLSNILEALRNSQMNLNPQQEGTTIYVALPKVTKDFRQNLAKTAKQNFVQCKETISDIRNHHIKELKKETNISKDLIFRAENYIGAMQKIYVQKAENILKMKQKELLGES